MTQDRLDLFWLLPAGGDGSYLGTEPGVSARGDVARGDVARGDVAAGAARGGDRLAGGAGRVVAE